MSVTGSAVGASFSNCDELLQHNHRELYDLGISPGDIHCIAWQGAWDAVPHPAN